MSEREEASAGNRWRARMFAAHSSLGLALFLPLFTLSFTGTVALFVDELSQWELPPHRRPAPPVDLALDPLLRPSLDARRYGPDDFVFVFLPTELRPTLEVLFRGPEGSERIEIDPHTGEVRPAAGPKLARFLRELHTDLYLPAPWGGYAVGLLGILMTMLVATGTLLHRRRFRDWRTFRPHRSRRLLWRDAHTVLGSWGLPFHLVLALTGGILGLSIVFVQANALVSYGGDVDAAVEAVLGSPPDAIGRPAPMPNLDALLEDAEQRRGDQTTFLEIRHWRDEAGWLRVLTRSSGSLNPGSEHRYAIATGAHLESRSLGDTRGGRIYAAVVPLHFGDFGGLPVKLLYALLGLGMSALTLTGALVWLERIGRGVERERADRLRGWIVGFAGGLLVANLAAFHASQWLPHEGDQTGSIAVVFFASWVACGAAAWRRPATLRRGLLRVAALAAISVPAVHAWRTGDALPATLADGRWPIAGVDLTLLLVGIAAGLASGPLLSRRGRRPEVDAPASYEAGR